MSSTRMPSAHSETLRIGFAAVTKSLLLTIGVPAAVYRLFALAPRTDAADHLSVIMEFLLCGVGICWALAVSQLVGDVRRALRSPGENIHGSWSSTWAGGIVGLLIFAGALTAHGTPHSRVTPITQTLNNEQRGALFDSLPSEPQGSPSPPYEELIVGVGLLTTAALLRRTRLLARLRTSLRAPHARTLALCNDLQQLVSTLDRTASETMLDWIEAINRFLGARFFGSNEPDIPEIALMRVGTEGIELLLQRPIESAPPPFKASHQGWWWRLDPSCDIAFLASQGPRLAPWLVPVGHDGTAEVLVALGPGKTLGLIGPPAKVDDTLRALVTGLRVLPWCDELTIELCGIEAPPLFEQSMHMQSSSNQTLSDLYGAPRPARHLMQEEWRREPLVVIHRRAVNERSRSLLLAIKSSVGALVGDRMPHINLQLSEKSARLEPFGIDLDANLLSEKNELIIDRLLRAYAQPNDVMDVRRSLPNEEVGLSVEGACEISILGPTVEVRGAQHQPHSDDIERVHELLVYLALHNYRASIDQLINALFIGANAQYARTRLENLIAMSRAALGRSTDGNERIRRPEVDIIVMDESVTLDWHRVQRAIIDAQSLAVQVAIPLLQEALSRCMGEHLLGQVTRYPWFHATRYDEFITSTLIDACHHLATLTNVPDSREVARWSIDLGQRIEPASEIMTRDLMVLLDAEGRSAEIAAVYMELQRELVTLGGAEPSAVTHQLYLVLTSQERTA